VSTAQQRVNELHGSLPSAAAAHTPMNRILEGPADSLLEPVISEVLVRADLPIRANAQHWP
jgi:hypothetical protein